MSQPTQPTEMKVFRINDCEWWMAPTLEEAIAEARRSYDVKPEAINSINDVVQDDARMLTDEEMDRLKYIDDLPNASPRSFREELAKRVAEGVTKPEFFATTEY